MADVDEATLLDIASRIELYRKGLAGLDLSDTDLEEIQTLIGIHLSGAERATPGEGAE